MLSSSLRHCHLALVSMMLIFTAFISTAKAQTAQRIYELNNSFAETNGGTAMVTGGGTLGSTGYTFAAGQGPSVSNALANTGEYSIEMVFRINDISGYRSLINFKDRGADEALYSQNGRLIFYNVPGGSSTTDDLVNGQTYRLIVTRNATTKLTTAYLNGVQKVQVTDNSNFYVASASGGILHFLRDNGSEHPSGFLDQVRIYHSVLTAAQVTALGGPPADPLALWQAQVSAGTPYVTRFTPVNGSSPVTIDVGPFATGSARSFEFVFTAAGAGPSRTLLGSRVAASGNQCLKLNQWQNTGKFGLTNVGESDYQFSNSPTISNQRVHAVFTSNGSVTTLYLNGVAQSGTISQGLKITGTNGLGAIYSNLSPTYDDNLDGTIDGFASYARALTQSEITARYNALAGPPANTAPVVAVNSPASVSTNEGTAPTKSGTFSDVNGNSSVTITASAGTVTQNNTAGTWSWTGAIADGPASGTITITATDSAGAVATTTFTSTINNVVPVVSITAPASGNEDTPLNFTFTATDVSTADQSAGFTWSISYGDGSAVQNVTAGNASPLARSYTYQTPGTYTISVTATDKNSGVSIAATRSITIQAVVSYPEIQLRGNSNLIADGALVPSATNHTRFGSVATPLTRSFSIENAGPGGLTISSITVAGENASEFAISAAPTSVAAGSSASFNVTFTPTSGVATSRATITVNNNDPDEAAYDFVVEGEKTFPTAGPDWTTFVGFSARNAWSSITYGGGKFVAVAYFGYPKVMHSPDGQNWTSVDLSADNMWMSVAYGNGRFVAVSQTGTSRVMTSPDGVNWTSRNAAENQGWVSVTYGNGLFVAVSNSGTNNVMTSPDGITWTARTTNLALGIGSVTYGNGLFVATVQGMNSFLLTSPDGVTWTQRSAVNNQWASVCYGNGRFVAVSTSGTYQAATSTDGITWTPQTVPTTKYWWKVAYGNGIYMATAYEGNVMTSPDGVTWTAQASVPSPNNGATGYGAGRFVVSFGYTVAVFKPTNPEINVRGNATNIVDGDTTPSTTDHTGFGRVANSLVRTFTIENTGDGTLAISSVNVSGENASEFAISNAPTSVAAFGSATFNVTYTPTAGVANSRATITIHNSDANEAAYDFVVDGEMAFPTAGETWSAHSAAANNQWNSVTYGNGLFVAVSNDGAQRVMTSPDGITWTARPVTDGAWSSVTYGKGLFVAVAFQGSGYDQVMTSPDGINWTFRTGHPGQWRSVTYGNGLFVAVANDDSNCVMTSPDGITWTQRNAATNGFWSSVAYGNGVFTSVPFTLQDSMYSTDGVLWNDATSNSGGTWRGLAFGNGRFIAVGDSKVSTSPEGNTWFTQSPIPGGIWVSATYGNGMYVAVAVNGINRAMSSPNGNSWTARTATANAWSSVAYGKGRFVAVSTNGTNRVMTSGPTGAAATTFWATSQGLSGPNALPTATPFGDGVPNLLKYAFNMPLDGPRSNAFNPAAGPGANGLPVFTVNPSGPNPTLTANFLRRRNSGLNYVPQRGTSLGSFSPMTGPQVVTPIDADWELVTVEEPLGSPVPSAAFSRVAVSAP